MKTFHDGFLWLYGESAQSFEERFFAEVAKGSLLRRLIGGGPLNKLLMRPSEQERRLIAALKTTQSLQEYERIVVKHLEGLVRERETLWYENSTFSLSSRCALWVRESLGARLSIRRTLHCGRGAFARQLNHRVNRTSELKTVVVGRRA